MRTPAEILANKETRAFVKDWRTEIAACSSSIISTSVSYPLDFTKSRMQSYGTGFLHTVKDAYKAEGIRAFWRGVLPPVLSVTFSRTFSFAVYQRTKYAMDRRLTEMFGKSPLELANAPDSYPSLLTVACFLPAGATAGLAVTVFSCPFELTKLNEQLAGKEARGGVGTKSGMTATTKEPEKTGAWRTGRRLVRDRGILGLYAGFRLHLLRDTIGSAVYFTTYESVKQILANGRGREPTSPGAVIVAGGLCGIVSWACIYPIDTAKTLYQKALLSAGSGEAPRPSIKFLTPGSYRGLGVSVARSCLINAIFFSSFEAVKKRINALEV